MIDTMKIWKNLERKKYPFYLKGVEQISFKNFKSKIDKNKNEYSKKVLTDLYNGKIYLIRQAFQTTYIEKLKNNIVSLGKKEKSSFHKMHEGCPNFNRFIEHKVSKNYSVNSFRHIFYFFRWNKDKLQLFRKMDKIWDYIKFLNGYSFNEFKKNTPKNGIIDRIQIVRYPNKSGYIEPHQHHPGNIRIILNVYLSKKGKDFSSGGVMFYKKGSKIEIERKYKVNKGDALIFFSTMRHSVDEIIVKKNNTNSKNKFKSGRWWIGLYSPESDYIKDRKTSKPA